MQGTTIEITLWRGVADKFYDHIEEGQVRKDPYHLPHFAHGRWPENYHPSTEWCQPLLPKVLLRSSAPDALLPMQVYYFRRGTVKLSQGKFKSARNDYIISMDTG